MSNRTLYIVISVVIVIIVIGGGITAWFAWQNVLRWQQEMEEVEYDFVQTSSAPPSAITLSVDLGAGAVNVTFEDNSTLIYRIHLTTTRLTVNQHGDPSVTYATNEIDLTYAAAYAEIVLGSGANYTLNVVTSAGAILVIAGNHAHLNDIAVNTSAGAIDFQLTSGATINGNITVALLTSTGAINVDVALPSDVGGSFNASAAVGSVDVNPTSPWSLVSGNEYETSDYDTATKTVTISATTSVGAVTADLS